MLPWSPIEDRAFYLPGQYRRQLLEQAALKANCEAFRRQLQGDQLLVDELGQTALIQEIVMLFKFVQKL